MPVKIFCCYAHKDEQYFNKLKSHLKPFQRLGIVDIWHDHAICAGVEWEQEIREQLNEAQIILLLVSPDFMDSDYCYSIEMKRALERHGSEKVQVIPIILRHVHWQGVLGKLLALPTDGKPVVDRYWHSQDEAFSNIIEGIRKIACTILGKQAYNFCVDGCYNEALAAYDQALQLNPNDATICLNKGNTFMNLKRYNDALLAYDQATSIHPNDIACSSKGRALEKLNYYNEALVAYDQALQLNRNSVGVHRNKGNVLRELKRYNEAKIFLDRAIHLNPDDMLALEYLTKLEQECSSINQSKAV